MSRWLRESLCYCSNVHPGATLSAMLDNVRQFVGPVQAQRQCENAAAGLWIANEALKELQSPVAREAFISCLLEQRLQLATLNGFPYGDFHQEVVKQAVYEPAWDTVERLEYTVALAELVCTLPDTVVQLSEHGFPISTVPLGYRQAWNPTRQNAALHTLIQLVKVFRRLESESGRRMLLCLEMEPDCVLESTTELCHFFTEHLLPLARAEGLSDDCVLRYIGCCYDTCHQAVMHENISESLGQIIETGITIGKVQISNAFRCDVENEAQARTLLNTLSEPKFLHQVKIRQADGGITSLSDLDEHALLKSGWQNRFSSAQEWRIHFHVPIHAAAFPSAQLHTTQSAILETLNTLARHPSLKPCMEVETYTWHQVQAQKLEHADTDAPFDLIQALVDELHWLERELMQRGLLFAPE